MSGHDYRVYTCFEAKDIKSFQKAVRERQSIIWKLDVFGFKADIPYNHDYSLALYKY